LSIEHLALFIPIIQQRLFLKPEMLNAKLITNN
jgi:hypothetical protein